MQFHLVSDGERSVVLDDPTWEDWKVLRRGEWTPRAKPIQAASWLDAKAGFGFELTAMQAAMLPAGPQERAAIQRSWAWRI